MVNLTPQSVWRDNDNLDLHNHCNNISYYVSLSQKLFWQLLFTASMFGMTGHDPDGVYGYSEAYHRPTFSLQRSFLKDDRLTVQIGAHVPFSSHTTYTSQTVRGDITGTDHQYMAGQSYNLRVTYRFGKLRSQVKKVSTSISNDDVVGGVKKQ